MVEDLRWNHGRQVRQSLVPELTKAVGSIALAKEESWHYRIPKISEPIETISIRVDGTCMLRCESSACMMLKEKDNIQLILPHP